MTSTCRYSRYVSVRYCASNTIPVMVGRPRVCVVLEERILAAAEGARSGVGGDAGSLDVCRQLQSPYLLRRHMICNGPSDCRTSETLFRHVEVRSRTGRYVYISREQFRRLRPPLVETLRRRLQIGQGMVTSSSAVERCLVHVHVHSHGCRRPLWWWCLTLHKYPESIPL